LFTHARDCRGRWFTTAAAIVTHIGQVEAVSWYRPGHISYEEVLNDVQVW
jgi:hypothetical protein